MITVRARIDDVGTTVHVDELAGTVEADFGLEADLRAFVARGERVCATVTGPCYAPALEGDPAVVVLTVAVALARAGWEIVELDPAPEPIDVPPAAVA